MKHCRHPHDHEREHSILTEVASISAPGSVLRLPFFRGCNGGNEKEHIDVGGPREKKKDTSNGKRLLTLHQNVQRMFSSQKAISEMN